MKSGSVFSAITGICLGTLLSVPVHGALFVVQPDEAKASSERDLGSGRIRRAEDTITGAGLADGGSSVETGEDIPDTWPGHTNSGDDWWQSDSNAEGDEWLMYDLGEVYELTGLHQWNFNNDPHNELVHGIKDVTIKFATDSAGYDAGDIDDASWGSSFVTEFAIATGEDDEGQTIVFGDNRIARFILLDTQTTHQDGYNRTGLSELRMIAIPEPSTIVLMIVAGLGCGFGMLRRKIKR